MAHSAGNDWLAADEEDGRCLSNRVMNLIPVLIIIFAYFWFNRNRIGTDYTWGAEIAIITMVVGFCGVCYCVYSVDKESKNQLKENQFR